MLTFMAPLLALSSSLAFGAPACPHLTAFFAGMRVQEAQPVPAGNEHLIHTPTVHEPSGTLWDGFFKAAAADHLTILRALALMARELKSRGVTLMGSGDTFERAVAANDIDLGLAIPARMIGLGIWEPDPAVTDPEFQLHLTIAYKEKFLHQFPDEVLPVSIKIGTGDETDYYVDRMRHHGYLLTADLYYGPHGIGFKNVRGIGAETRGLSGLLQRIFFFLPDSISSMLIDEERNVMVTEALFNTTVENFETRKVYQIRYRDESRAPEQMGNNGLVHPGKI